MKTLKFSLTFFVVMTLFSLSSFSQVTKTIVFDSGPVYYSEYYFPCIGETISGYEETLVTSWNSAKQPDRDSKVQVKMKGTFEGDDTGTNYYYSYVGNWTAIEWVAGEIFTGRLTACLEDEYGNVYYTFHTNEHFTVNANEEIPTDFWKEFVIWSCEF